MLFIKKRKQQSKNKLSEKDKKYPVATDPGRLSIHKIYFSKKNKIKLAASPIALLKSENHLMPVKVINRINKTEDTHIIPRLVIIK